MSNLWHRFLTNTEPQIHKWAHYFPVYEKHFAPYVNKSFCFWEIGVFRGGSVKMWKDYFGPFVTIVGIDIDSVCKAAEESQIHVRIGDQSDTVFLQSVLDEFGPPDIVLDDGSHVMEHINATFDFLYDKISPNGIYMIEDLHTAYLSEFGGGLKRADTFIERSKEMIDLLNARYNGLPSEFCDSTFSMSWYDSIVVFEKMKCPAAGFRSMMVPPEK